MHDHAMGKTCGGVIRMCRIVIPSEVEESPSCWRVYGSCFSLSPDAAKPRGCFDFARHDKPRRLTRSSHAGSAPLIELSGVFSFSSFLLPLCSRQRLPVRGLS